MKRTQILISGDQLQWLKRKALEKGVSMAHLIRESIDLYRSQVENSGKLHLHKTNALNAVGSFSSRTSRE